MFHRIQRYRPTADGLQAHAGRFRSDELRGAIFEVVSKNGRAFLERPDRSRQELIPVVEDLFLTDDLDVRFRRGADGEIDGFFLTKWRLEDIAFHRLPAVTGSK